jgi:hypothetical protein
MTNIQELIRRCEIVISEWAERAITVETVQDFAAVFDLAVNLQLVPIDQAREPEQEPVKPTVSYPDLDLTEQDHTMLGSWRERNGLNNGR